MNKNRKLEEEEIQRTNSMQQGISHNRKKEMQKREDGKMGNEEQNITRSQMKSSEARGRVPYPGPQEWNL